MKTVLPVMLIACLSGCRSHIQFKSVDPFYDSFFEKTSLIMTGEEINIYKAIPDKESKEEFIREFWALRDPDQATEENEAEEEFKHRVEYANKWFGLFNPDRGRDTERDLHSKTGWSSDRGKIYIVLGEPDSMSFGGMDSGEIPDLRVDGFRTPLDEERYSFEGWWYERYRLAVTFTRHGDDWRLFQPDPYLPEALETAKLNMIIADKSADPRKAFRFSAEYKGGRILIRIPSNRVTFDDKLAARFKVRINVYLEFKKLKTIEETLTLEEGESELLKKKNLILEIPFTPDKKGRYYFDIMIQDTLAAVFSRYRSSVQVKI